MTVSIRVMTEADHDGWIALRNRLWPEYSADHAGDVSEMLEKGTTWGFIAEDPSGAALGFAEVSVRAYANGCEQRPVPFLLIPRSRSVPSLELASTTWPSSCAVDSRRHAAPVGSGSG